jgi:hypothetical protein
MKKKMPYTTPEGYFEGLKQKLGGIPQRARNVSPIQRLTPYLALAAVFAAAFVIGGVLLKKTAIPSAGKEEIVEYLLEHDLTLAQLEEAVYYLDE